jgi:hypothetical protein
MYSIERFCNRAMLMDHGSVLEIGEPRIIGRAYHRLNFGQLAHDPPTEPDTSEGTVIGDAWFQNANGERITSADQDERVSMCFEVRFAEDLSDPVFGATLRTELGHTIMVARTDQHGRRSGDFKTGESVIASFELPGWLTSSRYTLTPSLARAGTGKDAIAQVEDMATIMIHGTTSGGLLEFPGDLEIKRL